MSLKPAGIISWRKMLLFSTCVFVFLFVVFPKSLLLNIIVKDSETSPLTIAYLNDLILKNPKQHTYKINLIEHEIKQGHLKTAQQLITNYIKTPGIPNSFKNQLEYKHYQIARLETFKIKADSTQRVKAEQALLNQLVLLQRSPSLTGTQIKKLGDDALALNQPALALAFYSRAAQKNPTFSPTFFAKAAKVALYVSDYEASATFYSVAMKKSTTEDQRKVYFKKAIDSLVAGGLSNKVLLFIEKNRVGLQEDRAMLIYLVDIALRINQPQLAEKYISQVLQLKQFTVQDNKKGERDSRITRGKNT